MTKQLSLCNQLQTAFVSVSLVPSCETNEESVSRRWEELSVRLLHEDSPPCANYFFGPNHEIIAGKIIRSPSNANPIVRAPIVAKI